MPDIDFKMRGKKLLSRRPLTVGYIALVLVIATIAIVHGQNGASKRKEANQLADKVGQLVDLSAKRSVLRFNGM